MKKQILRISAIIFGVSLIVIPGIIFGQKIIERFITPTKTMFSGFYLVQTMDTCFYGGHDGFATCWSLAVLVASGR